MARLNWPRPEDHDPRLLMLMGGGYGQSEQAPVEAPRLPNETIEKRTNEAQSVWFLVHVRIHPRPKG